MSKKRSLLILTILIQLFCIYTLFSVDAFAEFYIIDSSKGDVKLEKNSNGDLLSVTVSSYYQWSYDWNVLRVKPFLETTFCSNYTIPDSYSASIADYNWDELGFYKYTGELNESNPDLEKISREITNTRSLDDKKIDFSVLRIDRICYDRGAYGNNEKDYFYGVTYVKDSYSKSKRERRQPGLDFNNAKNLTYDRWDIKYPGLQYNKFSGSPNSIIAVTSMLDVMLLNPRTFDDAVIGYEDIFVPFAYFENFSILQNRSILEKEEDGAEPAIIVIGGEGITYRYKKSSIREKKF